MKRKKFLEKDSLLTLLEYKLEYREEQKRLDKEADRQIENSLLFMRM
ncbi:hypothetical protein [Oceanirhabdus sp. W0125-5]|nr:hypothetical protein [Oceanirhabdus sp. W0125-5]WBW98876.1 hypothetical protein OW730_09075 [Oceanirhabdus sp. W0125-5]